MWYFVEVNFQDRPLLIQKPFRDEREAEQAAIRETTSGTYRILSYPTRDKRLVYRLWKNSQMQ